MIFLVNPIGNFPLIDDWAYGRAVYSLINEGKIQFSSWGQMSLIIQVLWGFLFCLPFGFSFTTLRFSTLFLGLIGIFATYSLIEEIKSSRNFAFIGALLVAINPLYFELSNTFMTDIPFFALAMLSFFFFSRCIRLGKVKYAIVGSLFALLATFVRQLGVLIPPAFALGYLAKNGIKKRAILAAFLPAVILVGFLIAYQVLQRFMSCLPNFFSSSVNAVLHSVKSDTWFLKLFLVYPVGIYYVFRTAIWYGEITLIYLGLFIFPILFLQVKRQWQQYTCGKKFGFLIFVSVISFIFIKVSEVRGKLLPMFVPILFPQSSFGLGPLTLRDQYMLRLQHVPTAPIMLRQITTIMGIAGAAILLWNLLLIVLRFFSRNKDPDFVSEIPFILFVVSGCILYFIPLTYIDFLDRYLIFLLPLSMIILKGPVHLYKNQISSYFALIILLLICLFTIGATHDYLSWNRARWKALTYLTQERNISYKNIDGGFEFNGWYNYDPEYEPSANKSRWWVENDDYVVSFGPMPGYEEVRKYSYQRWIPFRRDNILILRRPTKGFAS